MGLAGAGYGAAQSLEEILTRAFAQKQQEAQLALQQQEARRQSEQFNQRMSADAEDRVLRKQQMDADNNYRQVQLQRVQKQDATAASDRANAQGTRTMMGDFLTRRQPGKPLEDTERATLHAMAVTDKVDLPDDLMARPESETFTLTPGAKRFDATGRVLASAPSAAPASSDDLVKVDTMENGKRVTKWLPKSQVAGQTFESPSGGPTLASGQQRRILNFYNRMRDSLETVEGAEPAIAKQPFLAKVQGQVAPNMLQTPLQQSYRQAQRAFTEARLRKESGAAIPPHEYENDARTYFAQPGDDPATIAQKKAKRQALLESTAFEAGPAFEEFYGEPFRKSPVVDTNATAVDFEWRDGKLVPVGK
jgi:hypothetical protein